MLRSYIEHSISSGGTVSTVGGLTGMRLAGVYADSNFSGNSLTLQSYGPAPFIGRPSSVSGGTFTLTISASGFAAIPKDIGASIESVQFISGTTQGATTSKLKSVWIDI